MTIGYQEPLYRAWARMKPALFRPFDPGRWMVIGFTSFLAGLAGGNIGVPGPSSWRTADGPDPGEMLGFPSSAARWLADNPGWFLIILLATFLLIALAVTLIWLSSRGKFMFLDNVVHNRAEVAVPWQNFKTQADSLFVWRLCFGLILLALIAAMCVAGFVLFSAGYGRVPLLLLPLCGLSLLLLALVLAAGYISLFLDSFIIPIMYRYDLSASLAWRRFLPLLKRHPGHFLLYGLFMAALFFAVSLGTLLAGCLTCCIGFILLMIPYIGSVLLLPLSYTFRCFSLEFLAQFDPEFRLPDETGSPASPSDCRNGSVDSSVPHEHG